MKRTPVSGETHRILERFKLDDVYWLAFRNKTCNMVLCCARVRCTCGTLRGWDIPWHKLQNVLKVVKD
eukprot:5016269-Amphidinium_carterae.1